MTTTNPVISRLQNRRSRIQGMLSPGKKLHQPGASLNASLSPVSADFGGRKFQLAARKMRILNPENLGQKLSGGLTSLSTDIQSKFADIQKIIHINPGTSRQDNIWSPVETPLSDSQPARQDTPDEPGVLRSGSIIQKMNMVPKPGQSLDSFKEQVQKQPRATKSPLEKKPVIDKNTRRFSQVQEVTPGQKQTLPELPAVPVKPDEDQPALIQDKDTPEKATIQTQPDPSVSVTEKPVITSRAETPLSKPSELPIKQDLPTEMPLRQEPRKSKPVSRAEQHTPLEAQPAESKTAQPAESKIIKPAESKTVQPAESKTVQPAERSQEETTLPESQTEQRPQAQVPAREKEIFKALPVLKKLPVQEELKKALPVKRKQKEPQKPVARPTQESKLQAPAATTRPTIQRRSEVPARPTIQRQSEADVSPSELVRPVTQPPADADLPAVALARPAEKKPQTPELSDKKATALPAPAQTDSSSPEMPLQQNISYRQNASHAIRAIAPDQMKPVSQPSLIKHEEAPLLTRSKYRPALSEGSLPGLPTTHQDSSFSPKQFQQVSPSRIPDDMPMDLPHRTTLQAPAMQNLSPIPMPLALPKAAVASFKSASIPEPAKIAVQSSLEKLPRNKIGVSKTNNTIQRAWEGHTPPGQSASGDSGASNARSEPMDLETLAENVFPYVKRILEIEVDRSSGKLR